MFELHINTFPSLSILLIIIAGFELFFIALSFRYRRAVGGSSFLFLMLAIIIYTVGYAFELASSDLETALFFSNIQYFGIPFIPFFLYSLIYKYFKNTNVMPLKLILILLFIPLCTFLLHLTIYETNLFYINPNITFHNDTTILNFKKGIWYYINIVYTTIIILLSLVYSIVRFIKNKKNRTSIALIISATAFPFLGYLLYTVGITSNNMDTNPLTLGAACPLLAIAIFHLSLFEIVPVARDHIFENLDQGLLVINSENRLVDYNTLILSIFPDIEKYRIGTSINRIDLLNNDQEFNLYNLLNEEKTFIFKRNGENHHYSIRKSILSSTRQFYGGTIYILSDITEEKELEEKLYSLAMTDSLTGIENRRNIFKLGEKAIGHAARYSRDVSIIIFDIDHYKKINDTWGHLAGDRILVEITLLCKKKIRKTDSFGRYGGDEFVIILPEASHTTALIVAEKLRTAISETTILFNNCDIKVAASFGVATLKKGETFNDLFNRADKQLYKVKNSGRNRVCGG